MENEKENDDFDPAILKQGFIGKVDDVVMDDSDFILGQACSVIDPECEACQ